MNEQLFSDMQIELNYLDKTAEDIIGLVDNSISKEVTVYDISASTMLISQFYNGIENILKQILKYENISLPYGANSHIELFIMFTKDKIPENIPLIFTDDIVNGFTILRRFRHFARHGYAYNIDWERLNQGMRTIDGLYKKFKENLNSYLRSKIILE